MQHKASQGEYTGGAAPYGYRLAGDGEHVEEVAEEQAVLRAARALRASGLSLRQVAAELDRRGMRSRAGRTFGPKQVRAMVAG